MANNLIDDLIHLEDKSTFSDKVFNRIGVISSILAAVLFFGSLGLAIFNFNWCLFVFQRVVYPILFLIVISLFFGIAQLLRNRYLSSAIATIISAVTLLSVIAFIIFQAICLHKVYIVPFIFFS